MSEHTHDDCVACLQKRVRELEAELDAAKQEANDLAFELEAAQENNGEIAQATTCQFCQSKTDPRTCKNCGWSRVLHNNSQQCPSYHSGDIFDPF